MEGLGTAFDGKIVGFGSAAGENNLLRPAVYQSGNLLAGFNHRLFGLAAVIMGTGRVAEFFLEKRPHGRNHFRVMGVCGVVVQIDGFGHEFESPWRNEWQLGHRAFMIGLISFQRASGMLPFLADVEFVILAAIKKTRD